MKVVHNWLKDYLGEALPDAATLETLSTFHAFEVDGIETVAGETVIDFKVLPNRGSDCLSHRGIARELASLLDTPLMFDPLKEQPTFTPTESIEVTIEDKTACPRFMAALVTGITVGDSPEWLQTRLRALGQRPINNIVDATNYVMYALGQPLHAYDADLFAQSGGKWKFVVRFAREGETVSLLAEGGKTEDRVVTLHGTELLIVDGATDTPIGLAGVKGGRYAGVHVGTKNIIIEAAHFHPTITRKTARRLGIVIDASKRFENEPSRELPPYAQRDIIALIADIAGGKCEGVLDSYLVPALSHTTTIPVARVNALLGLTLSIAEMAAIINRIGANITTMPADESGTFTVVSPWERNDLLIAEDYIEEIGRIHGLNNVVSIPPSQIPLVAVNPRQYYTEALRTQLIQNGFSEVITSSFRDKDVIQLQNSLASDKSFVRSSIKKNIQAVLNQNYVHIDLLGLRDVRVFEIGTVFDKTTTSVGEHVVITLGVRTKGDGYSPKDDGVLEAACALVNQTLGASLLWDIEKGVGEADLSTVFDTLAVPESYQSVVSKAPSIYKPVSAYPAVARDVALWVNEGELVYDVESVISRTAGDLCVRIDLFDTFTKDGRTSYAFRLVFQSFERTLTDVEVNDVTTLIYAALAAKGWTVR